MLSAKSTVAIVKQCGYDMNDIQSLLDVFYDYSIFEYINIPCFL